MSAGDFAHQRVREPTHAPDPATHSPEPDPLDASRATRRSRRAQAGDVRRALALVPPRTDDGRSPPDHDGPPAALDDAADLGETHTTASPDPDPAERAHLSPEPRTPESASLSAAPASAPTGGDPARDSTAAAEPSTADGEGESASGAPPDAPRDREPAAEPTPAARADDPASADARDADPPSSEHAPTPPTEAADGPAPTSPATSAPLAGGGGGAPPASVGPDPEAVGPQIDDDECTDEEPSADAAPGGDDGPTTPEPALRRDADPSDDHDSPSAPDGPDTPEPDTPEPATPEPATDGPAEDALDDAPVDVGAELASLSIGVPPGEAVVGGGGGGGGPIAEAPEPAAPDVSTASPQAGLAQLTGLRPDKILTALGGVGQAVGREATEARAAAAAEAPTIDLEAGGATDAPEPPPDADVDGADPPTEGADTPTPPPTPTPEPQGRPAVEASAAPPVQGDAEGKLSEGDAKKMAQSIAKMPTRDPQQTTDAGPAPTVPASGNSDPSEVSTQRASVEQSLVDAEAATRLDVAAAMGEDHITHDRPARTLTAALTPGASAPAPVVEARAGETIEAAGVIAQTESGGEIDAAMAKAQADMATERTKHEQAQQDARDASSREIETLKSESAAEQAREEATAQSEVEGLRKDWQAEADKQTSDARKKADGEVEAGLETVDAEKKKGEEAAQKAIDDGEKTAADEQAKGEAEAEQHKKEGEQESGGIFGWLASKAKSFFSRIKKAISAAIDAARKAVKAAIDAAKKLASAAIEAARKAIVAAIRIVGKALIAISDTLLAAFPALKEKFRDAIQKRVDQATAAVNALAETLDASIQKALDALGDGLDAALGFLEKGLHMIVDGLDAVVQGAIKAAEGFVNGVLAFAAIIKDVAASPGQWISNLGAAVVDGIRNHLWGAFKTAAKEWFTSKVLEVIGIGGMVVQLLAENGFDLGQIADFAWDGLQAAIPAALIQILIEKLVSMIVPAAGAVKAIIEGLQAAWGTVSRIIAAISTFVSFLQAVKSGNAGPQFATALAAAGVVLIDFVANWLLRKLRKAGEKIGKKLKGMFKKKGKGDDKGSNKDKDKDKDDKPTAAEKRKVVQQAAAETRRMETQDTPTSQMPGKLTAKFKPKYKWIKRFEAEQGKDGRATIWLIASKHKVDKIDKISGELDALNERIAKARADASADPELDAIASKADAIGGLIASNPKASRKQIRDLKKQLSSLQPAEDNEGDEQEGNGDRTSRASDSSKNEKHGDSGRAMSKANKRIQELKEKLKSPGLSGTERGKIEQKIKNIVRAAQKAKQGEEHSRTHKR